MKKIVLIAILGITATNHAETEQPEKFSEKVGVVAIAVKDVVTDTTSTVKRGLEAGSEVAQNFLAATAARIKIRLEEARVKQAQEKADTARQEKNKIEKELAVTQEKLKQAQAALKQTQKALYRSQ